MSVQFDAALPFSTTGFTAGTFFGDGDPAQSAQSVPVPIGEATIVSAAHGADSQALFGVADGVSSSLTLNAQSTALALVFMLPGVYTSDPTEADARVGPRRGPTSRVCAAMGSLIKKRRKRMRKKKHKKLLKKTRWQRRNQGR